MKSHVSNLSDLAACIIIDAAAKCLAVRLEERDLVTMRSRAEHEGLSFFTITLPDLGKEFEKALASGSVGPTQFRSFRKSGKVPAFLRGFFAQVFCKATGRLLDEPDESVIEAIRQIALCFKKLKSECTPERVCKQMEAFIGTELDLLEPLASDDIAYFSDVSQCIWPSVVDRERLRLDRLVPKHGPGATAEKVSGNAKYQIGRWHDRLEPYFPLLGNAYSSESVCLPDNDPVTGELFWCEEFHKVTIVEEEQEQPVRVIPVPKTLKGPRIIAIEPVCTQYAQQAISEGLVKVLSSHRMTRGHLNFDDQTVNRSLALAASKSEEWSTLDLSSASDRVPYSLASTMFQSNPDIQDAIGACRSRRAQMPDGRILDLKKFASMGSALCFPVESMYFYTICVGALLRVYRLPVTTRNCYIVSRGVYVYGDDIIVPTHAAKAVVEDLQKYYCKVNVSKSFWTGKFRESCGMDAYGGHNVTPTYVRNTRPNNRREASALIGWVSASNSFYKRGYWRTAAHMMSCCESILGALPIVGPDCAGLGKVSFQHSVSAERWNKEFQIFEVKTWCAVPVYQNDELAGYGALQKCLLGLERRSSSDVPVDPLHLQRTARHGAVALKRRWVRPY